jgi:hypothetical protein
MLISFQLESVERVIYNVLMNTNNLCNGYTQCVDESDENEDFCKG